MLITMAGSALLGLALLRRGFRPRTTAWLLLLWLPLLVVLSSVVALGAALLPILFAWGLAARDHHGVSPTDGSVMTQSEGVNTTIRGERAAHDV